jgi:hypothetical protein
MMMSMVIMMMSMRIMAGGVRLVADPIPDPRPRRSAAAWGRRKGREPKFPAFSGESNVFRCKPRPSKPEAREVNSAT